MKGTDFRAALTDAGMSQKEFAEVMGVHRTVIGRQCSADSVEAYWVYALAGLVAARASKTISFLVS